MFQTLTVKDQRLSPYLKIFPYYQSSAANITLTVDKLNVNVAARYVYIKTNFVANSCTSIYNIFCKFIPQLYNRLAVTLFLSI